MQSLILCGILLYDSALLPTEVAPCCYLLLMWSCWRQKRWHTRTFLVSTATRVLARTAGLTAALLSHTPGAVRHDRRQIYPALTEVA